MQQPDTQHFSLADALSLAQENFEANELGACRYLCSRILAAAPGHSGAKHLLGLTAYCQGQKEEAAALMDTALAAEPENPLYLANAAEVFRSSGKVDKAVKVGRRAVAAAPGSVAALSNLALALYDSEQLNDAKSLHGKVLKLDPCHLASLNNLGSIARDEKKLDLAQDYYQQVLQLKPNHHEARNNLVTVLIEQDALDAAQNEVSQLLSVAPDYAEAVRNQGRIHLARLQLDAAERAFRRTLELEPGLAFAHLGLSQVLLEKNRADLALAEAEAANVLSPGDPSCLHQIALCHSTLNNTVVAQRFHDQVLQIDPGFTPSVMARGYMHMEAGDLQQARQSFEQARYLDAGDISPLIALSSLGKVRDAEDAVFRELEDRLPEAGSMPPSKQIPFRFGLAECYDGLGRYEEAWQQYSMGASLKRASVSYDAGARDRQTDSIIAAFTPDLIGHLRRYADASARPIFVLGMPRSGTTLTESILASHSGVFGAGELSDLQKIFAFDTPETGLCGFPQDLAGAPGEELQARVQSYLARLAAHSPEAERVTDKMPSNFNMVGLIHALLPNARIIHVRRNAMDTCLSCFTRLFERSQYQSYDLTELGRYYNSYLRLMMHWEEILPKGSFYTIDYENLVADPESQARSLVQFCGLEWESACLDFHTAKRIVKTASITQVRQPVYKTSVEKWRRYEQHLHTLREVLESGPEIQSSR